MKRLSDQELKITLTKIMHKQSKQKDEAVLLGCSQSTLSTKLADYKFRMSRNYIYSKRNSESLERILFTNNIELELLRHILHTTPYIDRAMMEVGYP